MYTVRDLLEGKGRDIWSVAAESTVYQALELMAKKNCGAVMVLSGGNPVGIFTERDYARKVVLQGKTSRETKVGDLMETHVLYVGPDDTIESCMSLMTAHRVRHLPVMDNDKLVGLVSIGDVVKAAISHRDATIRELEHYITGGHSSVG